MFKSNTIDGEAWKTHKPNTIDGEAWSKNHNSIESDYDKSYLTLSKLKAKGTDLDRLKEE